MKDFWKMVGGIGVLIFAYLILSNSAEANMIIREGGSKTLQGIALLQGREVMGVTK